MWHRNTIGYYSVLKRKEILMHATPWLHFEDSLLNEISQSQKGKQILHDSSTYMRYLDYSNAQRHKVE